MNRGNREVKGSWWLCPFLVVYLKAHHFPATWKYVIHTGEIRLKSIQMWLPKRPGILTTCSSSLNFSYDPEAFDCLCWCPGKNPYSHFQQVILSCFWLCPPLSLKDGWVSLVTPGTAQTPGSAASTYWLPSSLLYPSFPKAAGIVGFGDMMESWLPTSIKSAPLSKSLNFIESCSTVVLHQ